MREPAMVNPKTMVTLPYSQCPSEWLKLAGTLSKTKDSEENEFFSYDFRKRYAAILLKERGVS